MPAARFSMKLARFSSRPKTRLGKCVRSPGKGETELHIGDWPLATGGIMPQLLRAYQKAMPNVQVKLHDWPVEKNIAGVRDGRLQLAIILPPLKANALEELRFEQLFDGAGLPGGFARSSICDSDGRFR